MEKELNFREVPDGLSFREMGVKCRHQFIYVSTVDEDKQNVSSCWRISVLENTQERYMTHKSSVIESNIKIFNGVNKTSTQNGSETGKVFTKKNGRATLIY